MAFERAPQKTSGSDNSETTPSREGAMQIPVDPRGNRDPGCETPYIAVARAHSDYRASGSDAAVTSGLIARGRHPRRYVPDAGVVQAMLDACFIGTGLAVVFPVELRQSGVTSAEHVFSIAAIMLFANITLLYASGCYRRDALLNTAVARARLPVSLGLGALLFFVALRYGLANLFPATPFFTSTSATVLLALIGAGIVLVTTIASRYALYALVRMGLFHRPVIVIGTGERALHLHRHIGQADNALVNELHYVAESIIGGVSHGTSSALRDMVVDAGSRSIETLARDLQAEEIVVAVDDRRGLSVAKLLACKAHGLPITDFNAFFEREARRVGLRWLDPSWLVYSSGFQMGKIDVVLKRTMDIAGSLMLLIISAPVLICAIAAVALEGRSIFYSQTRVTQGGRHFELYKLRTMRADAEIQGPQWAVENDPRITRAGRFLRRARIDEIPQLWNVLRGDMSLVGPRPERPVFVEKISKEFPLYHLRHKVKTGLTGWAQINFTYGASMADAERKLEYDLYYVKNYSLVRDLSILLQTFWVLIWPQGVR